MGGGAASASHHIWLFVGLGDQTQVIRLTWQGLSPPDPFHQPCAGDFDTEPTLRSRTLEEWVSKGHILLSILRSPPLCL